MNLTACHTMRKLKRSGIKLNFVADGQENNDGVLLYQLESFYLEVTDWMGRIRSAVTFL